MVDCIDAHVMMSGLIEKKPGPASRHRRRGARPFYPPCGEIRSLFFAPFIYEYAVALSVGDYTCFIEIDNIQESNNMINQPIINHEPFYSGFGGTAYSQEPNSKARQRTINFTPLTPLLRSFRSFPLPETEQQDTATNYHSWPPYSGHLEALHNQKPGGMIRQLTLINPQSWPPYSGP